MNIDVHDDEQLRQAMQPLVLSLPPSLDSIEQRTKTLRRRRVRLASGSVGVGVAAAALVAAGPLHLIGYGPGTAGGPPICTPTEVASSSGEAFGIAPGGLPTSMRLGWTTATLPPMSWGNARRIEHPCALAPIHRLIDVSQGQVTRTLDVTATPLRTSTGDVLPGDPPATRPIDGNGVFAAATPGEAEIRHVGPYLYAGWQSEEYQYEVAGRGIEPRDMRSLLSAIGINGPSIDTSGWPSAAEFEIQGVTEVPDDGTEYSWMVSSQPPDGDPVALVLEVTENRDDLMLHADVGDTRITVGGVAALQARDGTVTWKPTTDTFAFIYGSLGDETLRRAATLVTTMSVDSLPSGG